MKKRFLCIVMTLCMMLTLLPANTLAANPPTTPTVDTENRRIYANGLDIMLEQGVSETYTKISYRPMGSNESYTLYTNEALNPTATPDGEGGYAITGYAIYGGGAEDITGATKITITGGKVNSIYGGGYYKTVTGNTEVTVEGGKINRVYGGSYYGNVAGDTSVTISGSAEIDGSVYGGGHGNSTVNNAYVAITGGMVQGSVYGGGNSSIVSVTGTKSVIVGGSAVIGKSGYGVEIEGDKAPYGVASFAIQPNLAAGACVYVYLPAGIADGTVIATGAVEADLGKIILTGSGAEGKTAVLDGSNIKLDVPASPVAELWRGGAKQETYTSIKSAVVEAEKGDTILLISNAEIGYGSNDSIEITGKDITLDLSGYTVTSSNDRPFEILAGAALTIKDGGVGGGEMIFDHFECEGLVNRGTLNITGAAISSDTMGIANEGGTVNISGGSVSAVWAAIVNDADNNGKSGTLNITGGTVSGADEQGYAIRNLENGKITISGNATVTSACAVTNRGTIYLYGAPSDDPKIMLEIKDSATVENTVSGYAVYFETKDTGVTYANLTDYYTAADTATVGRVHPEPPHTHCLCGEEACSEHDVVTFNTEWFGEVTPNFPAGTQDNPKVYNVVLRGDVTLKQNIKLGAYTTLNLCLNGHVLKGVNDQNSGAVIKDNSGDKTVTINICDCQPTTSHFGVMQSGLWVWNDTATGGTEIQGGVITGGQGGIDNRGTFNLYGGTIAGNSGSHGAGVFARGTVTIAGTVQWNVCTGNLYGGGVFVGGDCTISGTVKENTAAQGGGVYIGGGECTVSGEVTGNNATIGGGLYAAGGALTVTGSVTGNKSKTGGGLYVDGTKASVTLTGCEISGNTSGNTGGGIRIGSGSGDGSITLDGCTISGNTCTYSGTGGGGVYAYTTFNAKGAVTITGNSNTTSGKEDNLYLYGSSVLNVTGQLKEGNESASIGVSNSSGKVTSGYSTYNTEGGTAVPPSTYFHSDIADCGIILSAGEAQAHKHKWTYGKSGDDTLTASCTCGRTESLTLIAPTLTTYGEPGKSAEATLAAKAGDQPAAQTALLSELKDSSVEYYHNSSLLGSAPTNAGINYNIIIHVGSNSVSVFYDIAMAPLTVKAENKEMKIGAAVPDLTYSVSGLVNGDTAENILGDLGVATTADGKTAGSFNITFTNKPEQVANYEVTYRTGTLTVSPVTVTFNANGGSGTMNDLSISNNATALTKNALTREGYQFSGWNTASDGTGTAYADEAIFTPAGEAVTLYAQWTAQDYTITYDLDGGTATNPTTYTVETETITLTNPTKEGYTFEGWTGSNGTTPQETVQIPKNSTGNKSYTANWTLNAPTEVTISGSSTATYGEGVTLTAAPAHALSGVTYSYQWYSGVAAIPGATDATYTTPASENAGATPYKYTCKVAAHLSDKDSAEKESSEFAVTVSKASLTVTTENASMNIGGAVPDLTYSVSGLVNGDTAAGVLDSDFGATTTADGKTAGTFTITVQNRPTPANYTVTYTETGKLTVSPVTVTFDANGGSGEMDDLEIKNSSTALTPNTLTRDDYKFSGWNTASDGTGTVYADKAVFAPKGEAVTLYAQWTELEKYSVSGTVTLDEEPLSGITVMLKKGNKTLQTVTDAAGRYQFTNVEQGIYNIVATQGEKIVTVLETISSDVANIDLTMPTGNVNSKLEVEENTPDVVVGGLEEEADAVKDSNSGASSVTVTMTVAAKEENQEEPQPDITAIKAEASGKKLEFLEITVVKTVDEEEPQAITDASTLLTIVVPFDFTGRNRDSVTVYRHHDGVAEAMTKDPADGEEGFVVGENTLTIFAKRFSTYAIGYTEITPPSDVTVYPITATAGAGGRISPSGSVSVARNGSRTFAITPDEGYGIASVLVDGVSVGAVEAYTFEKVTKAHTIEATFRKIPDKAAWNPFVDVREGDWFHDGVKYVYQRDLMSGTADDRFSPYMDTSRGMIVTILWRMAGSPEPTGGLVFPDVAEGKYYADAVRWGTETGVVKGYDTGNYGPNDPVTREQLAAILYRCAGSPAVSNLLPDFADADKISGYARNAMCWAVDKGIVTGKDGGILDPLGSATRAEVAQMLMRYLKNDVK